MKIAEKEYDISSGKRPRVLLLGNGISRAYEGMSWNRLLDEIKDEERFPLESKQYIMPMPLKAAMLANNKLASKMREIVIDGNQSTDQKEEQNRKISWRDFVITTPEMRNYIRRLIIEGDFDYVLTTNYSYEIELSLLNQEVLTPKEIARLMNYHEVENAQTQFLINTFNMIDHIPVWHIHGEARKPNSMIIGSYYYGKILKRCVERLDGSERQTKGNSAGQQRSSGKYQIFRQNIRDKKPQKIGSWVDAFVLGDVYILGLGMDFSEADLWWLLEYKQYNRDICGKTVFFDPEKPKGHPCPIDEKKDCRHFDSYVGGRECRNLLLDTRDVEIRSLGLTAKNNEEYRYFYSQVASSLKKKGDTLVFEG